MIFRPKVLCPPASAQSIAFARLKNRGFHHARLMGVHGHPRQIQPRSRALPTTVLGCANAERLHSFFGIGSFGSKAPIARAAETGPARTSASDTHGGSPDGLYKMTNNDLRYQAIVESESRSSETGAAVLLAVLRAPTPGASVAPAPDLPAFPALKHRQRVVYRTVLDALEVRCEQRVQRGRFDHEGRAFRLAAEVEIAGQLAAGAQQFGAARGVVRPQVARQRAEKGAFVDDVERRIRAAKVKKSASIRRSRHGPMICAAPATAASLKSSASTSQPARTDGALPTRCRNRAPARAARPRCAAAKSCRARGTPPASHGVVPLR